jgi:Uma2 family endonuclease
MAAIDPSFPVAIATAEQLLAAGDLGRCELVAGRLVMMSPAGFEHGLIAQRIAAAIQAHAEPRRLGVVMNRLAEMDRCPTGFFEGAPDVVIEVLSPSDRRDRAALQRVHAKVDEWLAAGAIEVWTVDPGRQMVTIYRPQQDSGPVAASATFAADATLRSNALPGFSLPLSTIFRRPQDT